MNCKQIQDYCIEYAGEKLSDEVARHLTACETCRKAHERAEMVCKLISLKKYEQPDPGFEARSLARIQNTIEEVEASRTKGWRLWEIFSPGQVPALRYAMAAAVLLIAGLNYVSVRNLPALRSVASDEPHGLERSAMVASSVESNVRPLAPYAMVASNQQPGQVQYGPGPSRVVNFEY